LSCAALAVAAATLLPLVYLLARATDVGWLGFVRIIARARTFELIANTLAVMAGVAVLTLVLGVGTATIISRVHLPWPRLWWILAALPIAVPSYVAAFALLVMFPGIHGVGPTILVIALTTYPFVTLPTLAALTRADHSLADVARSLGASRSRAYLTVTFPQILPAAIAGTLLCVLYSLSDFAGPALLRTPTLTVGVYALFTGSLDRSSAAALSLVLVVIALLVVAIEQSVRRRAGVRNAALTTRRLAPAGFGCGRTALAAAAVAGVVGLAVVVPIVVLFRRLTGGSRYTPEPGELANAAVTTLGLGTSAAILATLAALPIAVLGARVHRPWVRATEGASFLGQALPGVVIALALVFASLSLTPWAYQTLAVLLIGYVILFLPKAIGSSRAAVQQVPVALEESARTLGRSSLRAWWTVTAPAALPGIAAGAVLVMAATMKEVPATLMLRPIGIDTLATELWSKIAIGAFGAAAPAALLLILVGIVPAWLLSRTGRA
jgi:iron(III) transport system permease protein